MRARGQQSSEHRLGLGHRLLPLAAIAAVTVGAGCESSRDSAPPRAPDTATASPSSAPATAPSPTVAMTAAPTAEATASATSIAAAPTPAVVKPRGPGHELDTFHAALRGLEKHTRKTHARVMWLGDSHGASDLWSGGLRMVLQKRFGDAGPGFVHVGNKLYRHDGTKITVDGAWEMRPKVPAITTPTGSGVFGLGGVIVAGARGASTSLAITDAALPPKLLWDVCYRMPTAEERLDVALSTGAKQTLADNAPGPLRHASLSSDGAAPTLTITAAAGVPELCGVIVETDPVTNPGVVVDTLGINGARLATPLAWNEAAWIAEVTRRPPDLVVFEYGTNESGDAGVDTAIYTQQMTRLLDRLRRANPAVDCVALAPTDRQDTPEAAERAPLVRDGMKSAAAANGCAFWDTYEAMGGKGAILKWQSESPPRASPDKVHLVAKGYRELGFKLADELLSRYTP